jgi:hypothetical protein
MNVSLASAGLGGNHAARQHLGPLVEQEEAAGQAARSFSIEDVGLRHLKTPSEIERILHLREAIDLSALTANGSEFRALEKKETKSALSADSNSRAR